MDSYLQVLCLSEQAHDANAPQSPASLLPRSHFAVLRCRVASGFQLLRNMAFDAVLLEPTPGGPTAEDMLEEALRISRDTPVIILREGSNVEEAVRLVQAGAFDYVESGCASRLENALERAAEFARARKSIRTSPGDDYCSRVFVGESPAIQAVREVVRIVAARRSTVLIQGETGTGKEVIARAIHAASSRGHLPMISVNCAAIPEALIEAELFGHVRGAFTGAVQNRIGRFEQANRSTIFLDEIGELPLSTQAKLLRLIQERELQRLGSGDTVKLDIRVIAATNRNLEEAVREKRFREDLYYRINVVPITLPPLRDRKSDIPLLAEYFVEQICREEELNPRQISPGGLEKLISYDWPGNVRQLMHSVELAIVMSGPRTNLIAADFQFPEAKRAAAGVTSFPVIPLPDEGFDFHETLSTLERTILEQALYRTRGNKAQAAQMLRMKRTTLSAKVRALSIGDDTDDEEEYLKAAQ